MFKKRLCLLMALLLLMSTVAVLGGCGDAEEEETTESAVVTYAEGDTYVPPDVDYGGKDFNVLTWSLAEDWVLEFTNELSKVDQEAYYHLATVESELNLNFAITEEPGAYDQMGDFINRVDTLVQSGDTTVDLVCQYSLAASVGTERGVYTDLMTLDHLKWDADYWSDDLKKSNTVYGKMYYCTGDMTASTITSMFLIAFNYDYAAEYQMGDLYATVKEGKWTIEKLKTLSAGIYDDLNSNNMCDVGDYVGFVAGNFTCFDAFQYGCDLPCIVTNSMGELEINPDLYGTRGVDVTDKIKDLLHNNGKSTYTNTETNKGWTTSMEEEKSVFTLMIASDIMKSLVTTDVNYGILPIPKYDEAQTDYHTALAMGYNMYAVPQCAADPNVSAAVLESMAHNGYVKLAPTVFEALQYRYSKRAEDTEMLTILRDGIVYEIGRMSKTINIFWLVRNTVRANSSITTEYAAARKNFEDGIEKVNFAFS